MRELCSGFDLPHAYLTETGILTRRVLRRMKARRVLRRMKARLTCRDEPHYILICVFGESVQASAIRLYCCILSAVLYLTPLLYQRHIFAYCGRRCNSIISTSSINTLCILLVTSRACAGPARDVHVSAHISIWSRIEASVTVATRRYATWKQSLYDGGCVLTAARINVLSECL